VTGGGVSAAALQRKAMAIVNVVVRAIRHFYQSSDYVKTSICYH
jgi:hypothetical protein